MKGFKKYTAFLLSLMLLLPMATFTACDENEGEGPIVYQSFTSGSGGEWNRFEGVEGYYEIQLTAGKGHWYSFSVSQSGKYALVTLEANDGVTIEQYNAESHYINPQAHPATAQEDGTLISEVECTNNYFSKQWRATYKISSTVDGTLKIRFYRVGDPRPDPRYFVTDVTAKEIAGIAPDMPSELSKKEVPWLASDNPSYFYDEDYEMTFTDLKTGEEKTAKGFYRYGKEGNDDAPVIWAAITSSSSRYLEDGTFSTIETPLSNLVLTTGTRVSTLDPTVTDYEQSNYVDFILNNGGETVYNEEAKTWESAPGDDKFVCYQNVTNKDGLFPVNQELYDFLYYYTKQNTPFIDDGVNIAKKDYWLAPCYYYVEEVVGSANYPYTLTTGTHTIKASKDNVYYKIKADTAKTFTITGSAGLVMYYDGVNYGKEEDESGNRVGFTVTVEIPAGESITFILKSRIPSDDYTITITEETVTE